MCRAPVPGSPLPVSLSQVPGWVEQSLLEVPSSPLTAAVLPSRRCVRQTCVVSASPERKHVVSEILIWCGRTVVAVLPSVHQCSRPVTLRRRAFKAELGRPSMANSSDVVGGTVALRLLD